MPYNLGDRVLVCDESENHGKVGTVWCIKDCLLIVQLDDGYELWPCRTSEVRVL